MLNVKGSKPHGCTILGKGIVDHPEMGVISECREVIFDEWDVMHGHWTGRKETKRIMYRTDNGYSFDDSMISGENPVFEIEQYAANWRAHIGACW